MTQLPVLIKCARGDEDGMIGFSSYVRIISKEEVVVDSRRHKELSAVEWNVLKGYELLRDANRASDLREAVRLAKKGAELVKDVAFSPPPPEEMSVNLLMDDALTTAQILERQISDMSGDARFVFWTVGKADRIESSRAVQISPKFVASGPRQTIEQGVLCPSFHTAAVFRMFYNGVRCCPTCLSLFAKVRPKQVCCSSACVAAHRFARFRDQQDALKGGK